MPFDEMPRTRAALIAEAYQEGQTFVLKPDYIQKITGVVKAERTCFCGLVFIAADVFVDTIASEYGMKEAERSRLEVALLSSDGPVSYGDLCDQHRYEAQEDGPTYG